MNVYIPVLSEFDDSYVPDEYEWDEVRVFYETADGLNGLPYFNSPEECQTWCDTHPVDEDELNTFRLECMYARYQDAEDLMTFEEFKPFYIRNKK